MSGSATNALRNAYRVFVGNLPWTISHNELRQFASAFGPVTQAHVVFDKSTGLSKGYGFVTFGNREGYNAATRSGAGSHVLEGHHVNIQTTTSGAGSGALD